MIASWSKKIAFNQLTASAEKDVKNLFPVTLASIKGSWHLLSSVKVKLT